MKTFKSRASPSREKARHLLHVHDCSRRAEVDMANNCTLLEELSLHLDKVTGLVPDPTRTRALERLGMEMGYLKTELGNLVRKIERLQSEVRWKTLYNLQDQG